MPDPARKQDQAVSSDSYTMRMPIIVDHGMKGEFRGEKLRFNSFVREPDSKEVQSRGLRRNHLTSNNSAYRDNQKWSPQPTARYVNSRCVMYDYFEGDINREVDEHFSRALNSNINSKEIFSPMSQRNFPASFWDAGYIPRQCLWSSDIMKAIDYSIHALYGKVADSAFKRLHPSSTIASARLNLQDHFSSVYADPWYAYAGGLNTAYRPQTSYSQQAFNAVTVVATSDLYRLPPKSAYPINRYTSIAAQQTLPAVELRRQGNSQISSLPSGLDPMAPI